MEGQSLELKNLAFDPHDIDTKHEELHRSPLMELAAHLLDRHVHHLGYSWCFLQTVYKEEWEDFAVLSTSNLLVRWCACLHVLATWIRYSLTACDCDEVQKNQTVGRRVRALEGFGKTIKKFGQQGELQGGRSVRESEPGKLFGA